MRDSEDCDPSNDLGGLGSWPLRRVSRGIDWKFMGEEGCCGLLMGDADYSVGRGEIVIPILLKTHTEIL